ncbi:hypothetical protein GCM10010279_16830 [Streptomyces mutabilis]|nr:hypothetical protein GCM10010279_16830 [Streptomyces mutabilis]
MPPVRARTLTWTRVLLQHHDNQILFDSSGAPTVSRRSEATTAAVTPANPAATVEEAGPGEWRTAIDGLRRLRQTLGKA